MPLRKAKSTDKITVERLVIPDVLLLKPKVHRDQRGFVSETWNERDLKEAGFTLDFVQDNLSYSKKIGTLRGMHCQKPPYAQGKLVIVMAGQVIDVALDVRIGSPTYGMHVTVTLTAENPAWMYVPPGFMHGFCTMTPDTVVLYKMTEYYAPEHEAGVVWNDPTLGIAWPFEHSDIVVAAKDSKLPLLKDLPDIFHYKENAADIK